MAWILSVFILILFSVDAPFARAKALKLEGELGRSIVIECADGKLTFHSSIPGQNEKAVAAGKAVALIVEAPGTEPRILTGVANPSESGLQVSSVGQPSTSPFTAVMRGQPITVSRLRDSFVVQSQGKAQEAEALMRDCGAPSKMPPQARDATREIVEDLTLRGDLRWVVLASRKTPEEALALLEDHRDKFDRVQVLKFTNGQFAVVAGPVHVRMDPRAYLRRLIEGKGAPHDTFLSDGRKIAARLERVGSAECVVSGLGDDTLNVRASPNGNILGELEMGEKVHISDRRDDNARQPWLLVKARISGWVYARYVRCN